MKILRGMENGTISIEKMGIIKTFFVLILSILLEMLGLIPITILKLFFQAFETATPYVNFVLGIMVRYFVIIILLKAVSDKTNEERPKHYLKARNFVYTALIIIAFRMIFDNSLYLWTMNIPMPEFINNAFEELLISPIILILSVAIVAPIYEEIVFRGIFLNGMAKKMNPAIALVISALFFAVIHLNIPQGINAFLLGLLIGAIYLKTQSIYLSIFAHFVNNVLAITVSNIYMNMMTKGKYAMGIHGMFFIVGVILLVVTWKAYKKNNTENIPATHNEFLEM